MCQDGAASVGCCNDILELRIKGAVFFIFRAIYYNTNTLYFLMNKIVNSCYGKGMLQGDDFIKRLRDPSFAATSKTWLQDFLIISYFSWQNHQQQMLCKLIHPHLL